MPFDAVRPPILIAGPTASGKSELGLQLAERFDGVVINADSMQVYKELRILTARPDAAEEARAPHRLYGILPVGDPCSAGRWLGLAKAELERAAAAGRVPIVVGGSGLYFSALVDGIADIPAISAAARQQVQARLAAIGADALHGELQRNDPEMAARIPASDRQRLLRASEVLAETGVSLAEWQRRGRANALADGWLGMVIETPRERLYARCDERFEAMLGAGALAEVAALQQAGADRGLPAMKALGIPELLRHLDGEIDLMDAKELAKRATRQYAKRQLTWLRRKMIAWKHLNLKEIERNREKFFSFISHFLLTGES